MNNIAVIHLVNGGFSIVSPEDFSELNKEQWFRNSAGYAYRQWTRQGKHGCEEMHNRIHRTPKGFIADHINKCKFDNRRSNLRTANKSLNALNGHGKGVSLHKATGLWRARLHLNGKEICRYFKTEEEALRVSAKMRQEAIDKLAQELAKTTSVYEPVIKPSKSQRKSIPMIREECVDGDIARIPLLRGGHAIIDADLFDELSKIPWRRSDTNHVAAWVDGKYVYLHRLVHKTDAVSVDHKNRNPLDNRRCNLRDSNEQLNRANTAKSKGAYHSEFKGVTWHKGQEKWMVTIVVDGKHNHLGYFSSEIQAMSTYNIAALKAFGEFACLNVLR